MRIFQQLTIALFFALLTLPGVQTGFRLWDEVKLHGVEAPQESEFPHFTVDGFLSGSFQQAVQEWLDRSVGFRAALIRSDNQLNLSIFREISSDYSSPLVLGSEDTLFERLYIDNLNNQWSLPSAQIDGLIRVLTRLNALLRERHIGFLVLLSPSKTSFYRDRVPPQYILPSADDPLRNNTDRFVARIAQTSIPFLDGRALARTIADQTHTPAFPRGGTHWTEFVACHVSQELMRRAAEMLEKPIPPVRCDPSVEHDLPRPLDRDLADLANVWNPEPFYERLRYPELPDQIPAAAPDDGAYRPHVLFVGGSFLWSIFVSLDFERVYATRDMLYYFQRLFRFPEGTETPIQHSSFDWDRYVFHQDLIVVELNEAAIHQLGSGFIYGAVEALEADRRRRQNEAPQTAPRDPKDASTSAPAAPPHAPPPSPGSTSDQAAK